MPSARAASMTRGEALQALGDRAVDVLLRKRFGGGAEHRPPRRRRRPARPRSPSGSASAPGSARRACGARSSAPRRCRPSAAPTSARRRRRTPQPAGPRRPAARSAPPSVHGHTARFSFCRPSRGPISTMRTRSGNLHGVTSSSIQRQQLRSLPRHLLARRVVHLLHHAAGARRWCAPSSSPRAPSTACSGGHLSPGLTSTRDDLVPASAR